MEAILVVLLAVGAIVVVAKWRKRVEARSNAPATGSTFPTPPGNPKDHYSE